MRPGVGQGRLPVAGIALRPNQLEALVVYERIGDRAAQADAYRKAIEMNPSFAEGHLFLAKLYLDLERNLDEATQLARKGVDLAPGSEYAPLGHYVMADVFPVKGVRQRRNEKRRADVRSNARKKVVKSKALAKARTVSVTEWRVSKLSS
jgi:tetratricopeptide (TPR) repeat protein